MQQSIPTALLTMAGILLCSCDQSTVHFPENSSGDGACGAWYPGGENFDAGQEYAVEEDAIFPCLVWESVRKNKENTWLSMSDLYLSAKHDAISAQALIVVKVGINCTGCYELVVELSKSQEQLSPIAVMLALTHGDVFYPDIYPLDKAEAVIVGHEGWPENWYLTNDMENHFSENQFVGIPWVTVVHLKTMKVISSSNYRFSATNVDELIELVEGL